MSTLVRLRLRAHRPGRFLCTLVLCPQIHVSWLLSCQHAGVESTPSLQSSATFSTAATCASSAASSGLSLPSSMNTVSSLCLGGTAVSAPSSSARATPLVTSGVCPPGPFRLPRPSKVPFRFPGGGRGGQAWGVVHERRKLTVSLRLCRHLLVLFVPLTS